MADEIKRLNFFTGQFLDSQDFKDEQTYHKEMRWRGNRLLFGPGVSTGLEVTTTIGSKAITLSPGAAFDTQGRELILLPPSDGAKPHTEAVPNGLTGAVNVVISYGEALTDSHSVGGYTGATRVTETPKVDIQAIPTAEQIVLATLQLDASGAIQSVDRSSRQSSPIWLDSGHVIMGKGRLHIHGEELLFLLNKSGVIVGKEWGGNGNLSVEGQVNANGDVVVGGAVHAGNSDLYFTRLDHNHSGFGNKPGYAAIENAADFSALMILGRAESPVPGNAAASKRRVVKLWDLLQVNGDLQVSGALSVDGDIAIRSKHALRGSDSWLRLNQDGAFASGVHTPGLFFPGSLTVGGGTNPGNGSASIAGTLSVGGDVAVAGKHALRGSDSWLRLNQDGAFASGVHTPGLFFPGSLTVGGGTNPGNGNASIAGTLSVGGDVAVAGKHALRGSDSWLRLNQDGTFSSGVHTPGLFFPGSLNVGGGTNPGNGNAAIAGHLSVDGGMTLAAGQTIDSPGRMHVTGAELLFLLHKDGVIVGREWNGNGNLLVEGTLMTRPTGTNDAKAILANQPDGTAIVAAANGVNQPRLDFYFKYKGGVYMTSLAGTAV